jgi:glucan 1,3-beta-glucosidase
LEETFPIELTSLKIYFPTGTYVVSSSIIDYYYSQLIGNANCPPTLKATANFTGFGVIDGDLNDSFGTTNIFWRQVRNFVIDMTSIPASTSATGIHWPTAQATSLQNILFEMVTGNGTQHQGIYIESGSGGYMGDLTFNGGLYGLNVGNQQFTMRNMTFNGCGTAINQFWDWGWTYKSMYINNCGVALNMSSGATTDQSVGSVTFIDSSITNTPIGFITGRLKNGNSQPPAAGSLILENVALENVPIAVEGPDGTALAGTTGSTVIAGWGQGHAYTPNGPQSFEGPITPNSRPGALLQGDGKYYERSKPQYGTLPVTSFLSARSYGATGNGKTDDTAALQNLFLAGAAQGKVVFVDAGTYKVTSTVYIPAGSKIVGETYPVIMSSGSFFNDWNNPQPMLQIGHPGESGEIEWSDMIVSTQGQQEGAVLIEWNLASSSSSPSGMWDVHARIGGFAGSDLQLAECPTTPDVATPPAAVNAQCIAAFLTMHVTESATGLYMENVWLWTADHDVEDPNLTQITIYTGRGLYVESKTGVLWLYGTAVEHHSKYQVSRKSRGLRRDCRC